MVKPQPKPSATLHRETRSCHGQKSLPKPPRLADTAEPYHPEKQRWLRENRSRQTAQQNWPARKAARVLALRGAARTPNDENATAKTMAFNQAANPNSAWCRPTKTRTGKPSAAPDKQPRKNNLPGEPRGYWLSDVPPEGRMTGTLPPKPRRSSKQRTQTARGAAPRSNVQIEGLAATKREQSPESSKNRRP